MSTIIKTISISGVNYEIRNDYLHRGKNPRLVLNTKESGGFVWVQFDEGGRQVPEVDNDKDKEYRGYWCNKTGYKPVTIKIITEITL